MSPNDSRNNVTYLSNLVDEINIPLLKDNVDENEHNKNIPNMVSEAIKSGSPANNPRSITSQEMEILYNFKT